MGKVVVIDNMIMIKESKYCVLVFLDDFDKEWLKVFCLGLGVWVIIFLNDVLIWYEVWC